MFLPKTGNFFNKHKHCALHNFTKKSQAKAYDLLMEIEIDGCSSVTQGLEKAINNAIYI